MDKKRGRNVNRNDTAVLSSAIAVGNAASVKIFDATTVANMPYRIIITVTDKDTWIKLQPAATDNDKKGTLVVKDDFISIKTDMYNGEISAIAKTGTAQIYVQSY